LRQEGWYWLDPAVALSIALLVAYHAIALIRKVLIRLGPAVADGSSDLLGTDQESPSHATRWEKP
jgi:Co/Zn/Cd efflux system component